MQMVCSFPFMRLEYSIWLRQHTVRLQILNKIVRVSGYDSKFNSTFFFSFSFLRHSAMRKGGLEEKVSMLLFYSNLEARRKKNIRRYDINPFPS